MATSQIQPHIKLSENHSRSISITLQLVDEALCEWQDWAQGNVRSGVMFREEYSLSPTQKVGLLERIAAIRELLTRLRDDLQLEPKMAATSHSIRGQAAVLWETLADLNSRGLKGHGKVPDELSAYLDPIGERLCEEMNAIARLFSR
jgi:hypothetical protein